MAVDTESRSVTVETIACRARGHRVRLAGDRPGSDLAYRRCARPGRARRWLQDAGRGHPPAKPRARGARAGLCGDRPGRPRTPPVVCVRGRRLCRRGGAGGARGPGRRRGPALPAAAPPAAPVGAGRGSRPDPGRAAPQSRRICPASTRAARHRGSSQHHAQTRSTPTAPPFSTGEHISTGTVVWTAGVRPNPLLAEIGVGLDASGRVEVDGRLRVAGRRDMWALGDAAAVPNPATPGRVDPPTCQHALRQARRLAANLVASLDGTPERTYRYKMLGQVATLGQHKGVAEVLGLRVRGWPGWWLTRTYHLTSCRFPRESCGSCRTGR